MEKRTLSIKNKLGLHTKLATNLVKCANKFQSKIKINKDRTEVNGKSIMGILSLAAEYKSKITISAEGSDEKKAIENLSQLLKKFKD